MNNVTFKEIEAKSMLHYHERTFATNWDANIYRGCEHNCKYCFAQYSHKYLESKEFFKDIFVKINAPEILAYELGKRKWDKSAVNVCGISDCYQPQEAKYKIMPDVIKSFIINKNPLVITTKSVLILRDIELLKKLNKIAEVSIMISVSTLDEEKRKLIEPNASPTISRMKMLKKFSALGFKTSVLFMPIIPYITDSENNLDEMFRIIKEYNITDSENNLDEMFRIIKEYNLGPVNAWPLHLRGNTKNVFYSFLYDSFPKLLPKYKILYKNGSVSKIYRANLMKLIFEKRKKYQLYSVYKHSKPKIQKPTQLNIFD